MVRPRALPKTFWQRVRGVKTYLLHIISGLIILTVAILDYLGTFDWTTILAPKNAAYAALWVNIAGILFRYLNRHGGHGG
ncbi:MAG: hypothetical protein M3R04_07050 [bacterium]|nr:hypothetical protein [bacterium]